MRRFEEGFAARSVMGRSVAAGMRTVHDSGIREVLNGVTILAEALRTTRGQG